MVDWLYIGYCTVMAMFAVAAAYAAAFGLRALRRLPRSLLVGFAAAAIVATLTAQKTNNVPPNMNQPQMMQGGGSFQTGFTGLTGLPGSRGSRPSASYRRTRLASHTHSGGPMIGQDASIMAYAMSRYKRSTGVQGGGSAKSPKSIKLIY